MRERVVGPENPRRRGKALTGPLGDSWRCRVGDYRIVCDIRGSTRRVLVIRIGNRSDVYR
ncbi:MAG TPA: type II toxin-antitoxin system RelE/ParE family toxin [Rhodanobacter sp.]|nr:type II toxin-antitoxin system RelE/ParE family toxin [Rhodanobacter sp.]